MEKLKPVPHQDNILQQEITGILDKGVFFEGRLTFEGTVRIGGHVKGEIFTKGTLIVDPEAIVEAQIEASTVVVSGTVRGSILAYRRVIMHSTAVFEGKVTAPCLSIAEGVVFEGTSNVLKPEI